MIIYFDEDNMPDAWTDETMHKAADFALEEEGIESANTSISVSFVGLDEIHALNKEYRGVDRPTDVLSFPMFEPGEIPTEVYEDDEGNTEEIEIGDVVICREKAKEQAEEFGHSYERELIYLFTHSIFHLLGYDHETDDEKAQMRGKEELVMNRLGITR